VWGFSIFLLLFIAKIGSNQAGKSFVRQLLIKQDKGLFRKSNEEVAGLVVVEVRGYAVSDLGFLFLGDILSQSTIF